jgi:hypothetical protein
MGLISTYPKDLNISLTDKLLGTDADSSSATKNFEIADFITFVADEGTFVTKENCVLPTYANNSAAISGGLAVNSIYKTATGEVRIVV